MADDPLRDLRASADARDRRASSLLVTPADGGWADWNLVGLPYDGGIPSRPGARFGPTALRRALAGFSASDASAELPKLLDLGDIALPPTNGAAAHARIEEAARRLFTAGRRTVFVGGDHGCTGSIIRGLAAARPEARLCLVTIDAHLDIREYQDESSLSSGTPFRRALETRIVEGGSVAMIGLRDFANSAFYLEWAVDAGIHLYGADDVAERGAAAVAAEAVTRAGRGADSLYLSIDLDAADAAYAPGVSAPGIGGLSSREMIALVGAVASDSRLIGFDLMELSPPYDPDERTARLAARLMLEVLRQSAKHRD